MIVTSFCYFLLYLVLCTVGQPQQSPSFSVPEVFINRISLHSVQFYLHYVPCTAYEEESFEVSIWSNKSMKENGWMLEGVAPTSAFAVYSRVEPNFCDVYFYYKIAVLDVPYQFRVVLRFGTSAAQLESTPPHFLSLVDSMMDTTTIQPFQHDDYYTATAWVNPHLNNAKPVAVELANRLVKIYRDAESSSGSLTEVRAGFSGHKFQFFMNALGSLPGTRYLEVGVFNGSSLMSVLHNNVHAAESSGADSSSSSSSRGGGGGGVVGAVAIDIWDPASAADTEMRLAVTDMVSSQYNASGHTHVLHSSAWKVSPSRVRTLLGGAATLYFYDAGHAVADHFLSVAQFFSALADVSIFVVDDWNWRMVRTGTLAALAQYPVDVVCQLEVETLVGPAITSVPGATGSWHNGMAAFVLQKR
jgi:hypothetical protein